MALSKSAIRAIAIRRSVAKRADTAGKPKTQRQRSMPAGLLANCVAAAGFEQNATYGG